MARITAVDRNDADESVRRNFDAIEKKLGVVPNMVRTMAQPLACSRATWD